MEGIYVVIGLAIGAMAGWLFRKLTADKNMVSIQILETAKTALLQAENQARYLQERNGELLTALNSLRDEQKNLQQEKEQTGIRLAATSTQLSALQSQHDEIKHIADRQNAEIEQFRQQLANMRSDNEVLKQKNESIRKEIDELGAKYTAEFKVLANEILEDKSKRFTEENQKNIRLILDPLNQDLKEFRKKVEETYEKENRQRFSLEEKIKDLVQLNQRISDEANNLTKALKGQRKTQGDWGEMILENILQQSGLTEGREYVKQEYLRDDAGNTLTNEEGNKMQPDFIITYPDKRQVVIDSKVSLNAYERFSSAEDDAAQNFALQEHVDALYRHIDSLSKKNYQDYVNTLDFVMMFIPIEPAYLAAIQKDRDLWNYAYKKRILLISPTNLIAAVKLVAELWKKEDQNKNALKIAERGGALYDKFVGFVENLEAIGDHLQRSQRSYEDAMKQLRDGSGNLIGQVEKMRKLGISAKKNLPANLLEEAGAETEEEE